MTSEALPEIGSPERDEIDEIRSKLQERGYELHITKQQTGWLAALVRDNIQGASSSPYGFGDTAVSAVRDAWQVYLDTPSIHGYKPHPDDHPPAPGG